MMKKTIGVALALASALSLSACYTPQQQQGTFVGGALGAGTGALIGSAVSGGAPGAVLAGAAIGATSGALIGNAATAPRRHCVSHGYDAYGNRYCVRWAVY
jgi:hypothetical protein